MNLPINNTAATSIQRWFRSSRAYSMMAIGSKQLPESKYFGSQFKPNSDKPKEESLDGLMEKVKGKDIATRFSNAKIFREISTKNLKALQEKIIFSDSKTEKQNFIQKFKQLSFTLAHHSFFTEGLSKGISPLKELMNPKKYETLHEQWKTEKKLSSKQIGNTWKEDIEQMGDTGFSFFHLRPHNFDNENSAMSRLGPNIYQIPVDSKRLESQGISITYDDRLAPTHNNGNRLDGSVYKTDSVFYTTFIKKHISSIDNQNLIEQEFEKFFAELKKIIDDTVDLHFFMGSDISVSLASMILILKDHLEKYMVSLPSEDSYVPVIQTFQKVWLDINDFVNADNINDPDKLNALINGWIRPITRIPGVAYPVNLILQTHPAHSEQASESVHLDDTPQAK